MKKFLAIALMGLIAAGFAFARPIDSDIDVSTLMEQQTIKVEDVYKDLHEKARSVDITIEYTKYFDEVRIYYTCMKVNFDQGEAMRTTEAVLNQFQKDNQYFNYEYKAKDKISYKKDDRGLMMATYMAYVKMKR